MNNRNIDAIIPLAIDYIDNEENNLSLDGSINAKEYFSYIKSFGPAVRMAGLLKTIAFYERDRVPIGTINNNEKTHRFLIIDLIRNLMIQRGLLISTEENKILVDEVNEHLSSKTEIEKLLYKRQILEIIAAAKTAFALFQIPEGEE